MTAENVEGYKPRRPLFLALAASLGLALAILALAGPRPVPVAGAPLPASLPAWPAPASEVATHTLFLPLITNRPAPNLSVNPQDRQAALNFYNRIYRASEGATSEWTGNHATCDAGTTSEAFRYAVMLRINYFRAMAGVPGNVQLSDEYNRKAQQAALMMSVNGQLSHSPPPSWQCYTAEGKEAAGSSNLYLGVYGPPAISGYMLDPGSGNYFVGHRRWILYPQTQWMGSGDIPPSDSYWSSNALWVFDQNMWGPRPATREEFVAWPPPGYVPYQVVFPRWSFAYARADFSLATVEMSSGGQNIPLTVQPVVNGYGENTLVWEPNVSFPSPPQTDKVYNVAVRQVGVPGEEVRDFFYQVIVFDPAPAAGDAAGSGEGVLGGQF